MKKIETIFRKVFNVWELRSRYPSLRPQSILFTGVIGKVFQNKDLRESPRLFSAAGLRVVLTFPVCDSYYLGKGYASHHDDFAVENGGCPSALPRGRDLRRFKKPPRSFAPGQPMAAVPPRAVATSAQISLPVWRAVWSLRLSAGLRTLCPPAESS